MRVLTLIFVFLISIQNISGQTDTDSTAVDNKYREDQFYISTTYNLLGNKPSGVSQRGFSTGFHLGFIRDMPINERRNFAIGLGIGVSSNSYNNNILVSEDNQGVNYTLIDDTDASFSRNKLTTYLIEVPLEFRWRTSTSTVYKFWRIYTGFKFGYVVYNTTKFRGSLGNIDTSGISDVNRIQYGITLSAGYSTFNFHLYYSLNNIFKDEAKLNDQTIGINAVKIGLIVYIL
ncbi:outer membrane beta-barrel protein [Winogradskyella sp. 3972H.M.0a.05]|uniref:porin family protein n=1 Tax=Winogradskyella sp. 3972H.M.0a.05 TaxID=2950277 RepID=UPI00339197FF